MHKILSPVIAVTRTRYTNYNLGVGHHFVYKKLLSEKLRDSHNGSLWAGRTVRPLLPNCRFLSFSYRVEWIQKAVHFCLVAHFLVHFGPLFTIVTSHRNHISVQWGTTKYVLNDSRLFALFSFDCIWYYKYDSLHNDRSESGSFTPLHSVALLHRIINCRRCKGTRQIRNCVRFSFFF